MIRPRRRVRIARVKDIPVLARQRVGMFRSMGELPARERSAIAAGTRASLHASDRGRPLYASLGFGDRVEMRLDLPRRR